MPDDSYNFSFSGLKSAVINYLHKCETSGAEIKKADVAASFQQAVVDVLVEKTVNACMVNNIKQAALSGGVASNSALRAAAADACEKRGIGLFIPPPRLCTDNAVMIACRAFFDYKRGRFGDLSLNAYPGLGLG